MASLIAAEREFAAAASERGMKEAFLSYLSDDAILFRPRPVAGKEYLRSRPPSTALLEWDPEYADVSASGTLGYTTGPWILRASRDGEPIATGRYLTFWRRPRTGEWKAVIDHGVQGPIEGDVSADSPVERALVPDGATEPRRGGDRASLLAADSALGIAPTGPKPARYRDQVATEVRHLRDGSKPRSGRAEIEGAIGDGEIHFYPAAGEVAISGDLGYTYGEYEVSSSNGSAASPRRGTYLRGWRYDAAGRWLLVVDLMTLLPEQG